MSFTPGSPLSLAYKKFTQVPAPVKIVVTTPINSYLLTYTGNANWLRIGNIVFSETSASFFITLDSGIIDRLSPGNYSTTVSFSASNETDKPGYVGSYTVNLIVEDTVLLNLTPTLLSFSYNIGDTAPAAKLLQIASENSWTATSNQSWLNLSPASGMNNGTVQVTTDISGLAAGLYEASINVDDGQFTKATSVYLTVTEGNNETNYLYLNPVNFEFLSELSVANPNQKLINIDTANTWSAVSNQSWIVLSATSGAAGIADLDLSVDSAALALGIYQAEIVFTSNNIIKKIYVTLRVVDIAVFGLEDNTLYYADDRTKLTVSSVQDNTFLNLEMNTSNFDENINYVTAQPYFKGVCNALIGMETNFLQKSTKPTSNLSTRIHNEVKPININISAYDVNLFTGAQNSIGAYTNLKFLNGKTPVVQDRMSYIPQTINVSNKAILQLSVVSDINPGNAEITGAISSTVANTLGGNLYVYTLLLNLSEFTLVHADVFQVVFGGLTLNVNIDTAYTELNTLAFENEWNNYEFFETKGKLTNKLGVEKVNFEKSKDGQKHTRTISAIEEVDFVLNTGLIQTPEEVEWLSKILKSKRVFIYKNGFPVEVVLETGKMTISKTREYSHSYNLTFKNAIV